MTFLEYHFFVIEPNTREFEVNWSGIVVPQRLTLQLTFVFDTFAKVILDRSVYDDI